LAKETHAEWKLYLELLWETGAAQSDAVNFRVEDIDWQTRTISYFRQKTGSLAQFTIGTALARIFHSEIEQRSGESVRRLDITQPNENATHRFLYDRL
jgi:integrase